MSTVTLENTGQGEFTKSVTDHVFRDIDAHEILAVVDEEGVADEVRGDHGGPGPSFDGALGAFGVVHLIHLLEQSLLDEGAFFEGAWHESGKQGWITSWRDGSAR